MTAPGLGPRNEPQQAALSRAWGAKPARDIRRWAARHGLVRGGTSAARIVGAVTLEVGCTSAPRKLPSTRSSAALAAHSLPTHRRRRWRERPPAPAATRPRRRHPTSVLDAGDSVSPGGGSRSRHRSRPATGAVDHFGAAEWVSRRAPLKAHRSRVGLERPGTCERHQGKTGCVRRVWERAPGDHRVDWRGVTCRSGAGAPSARPAPQCQRTLYERPSRTTRSSSSAPRAAA